MTRVQLIEREIRKLYKTDLTVCRLPRYLPCRFPNYLNENFRIVPFPPQV